MSKSMIHEYNFDQTKERINYHQNYTEMNEKKMEATDTIIGSIENNKNKCFFSKLLRVREKHTPLTQYCIIVELTIIWLCALQLRVLLPSFSLMV